MLFRAHILYHSNRLGELTRVNIEQRQLQQRQWRWRHGIQNCETQIYLLLLRLNKIDKL